MHQAETYLKEIYGHSDFLHPQKEIIENVLQKKDSLAILPTGGGKSICYQIPALMLNGITLVISPLISLMLDQVTTLTKKGISAAAITSNLDKEDINLLLSHCHSGKIKLLYVAPERLQQKKFISAIRDLDVQLIAVDEAHCIAQWGHDFRPAYLKINTLRELFQDAPVLALTATATPKVQEEIKEALHLKDVTVFKRSLKRENLVYSVIHSQNERDDLVYELRKSVGSSIVFARTRKQTYALSMYLTEKEFNSDYFHAKIPAIEKSAKQWQWTNSPDGIMVATNAFGMGIDKADVRTVIHMDLPQSLEAYVQEAGRAGRDGLRADALLFLRPHAVDEAEKIFKANLLSKEEFEKISRSFYNYFEIGENERPESKQKFNLLEFQKKFQLENKKTLQVLNFLERMEVIYMKNKSSYGTIQVLIRPNLIQESRSVENQILLFLIRNFPGIHSEEIPVYESQIATALKIPAAQIAKTLTSLNESGYLTYQNRAIQNVYFLRPRETNYLRYTLWKEFGNLQIIQWKRLQDILYYATQTDICREKLILRYFGERPTENCGKCDVCSKNKTNLTKEMVLDFLETESKTLQEILLHFVHSPKEKVMDTLQLLTNEQKIKRMGLNGFIKK